MVPNIPMQFAGPSISSLVLANHRMKLPKRGRLRALQQASASRALQLMRGR